MVSLSIFVSATVANGPLQETDLAKRLIPDLRHSGATVVIDDETIPDAQFLSYVERELPQCHWLVVLKTAGALRSLRVQATIHTAQQLLKKRTIKGIIQIICPSSETEEKPLSWPDTQMISFQGDYPRVRDKLLLELDLLGIESLISKDVSRVPTERLSQIEWGSAYEEQQASQYPDIPAHQSMSDLTSAEVARRSPQGFRPANLLVPLASLPLHRIVPAKLLAPFKSRGKTSAFSPSTNAIVLEDRPLSPLPETTMRKRRIGIIALSISLIFFIVGSISLFTFVPRLYQASNGLSTPTKQQHPSPTSTPHRQILARDTFRRNDQLYWGTSSDKQVWAGEANTNSGFSISGNSGQIANIAGVYETTLGPVASDVDVTLSGAIDAFTSDQAVNFGIVLRWQDSSHWYKALIDGKNLAIFKGEAPNDFPQLGTIPFAARGDVIYTIRFQATGSTLAAKVWPADQAEPAQWMLTIQDSTISRGQAGIRAVLQDTTQIKITAFEEASDKI
jgi:hypothetical protein